MMRSVKSAAPAALVIFILSTAPTYAAGKTRNRDQEYVRSAVQRVAQIVKRLFTAAPNDGIIVPNP
ncbi:MAG: hypothetical protein JOZ54_10325 [Acidobacteria bacterium]|nr:hypothetical protein [Acidobacteriota bacterium]